MIIYFFCGKFYLFCDTIFSYMLYVPGGLIMNYVRCIPAYITFINAMLKAEKYKKPIEESKARGDFPAERQAIMDATSAFVDHLIDKWDYRIHIINPENLPDEGPAVYICNHQSYGDVLAMMKVVNKHQLGYVGKDFFAKIPVLGKWATRIRCLYLKRGNTRNSLRIINEGVEYLNDGFSLLIFPEGTRSWSSEMGEFKAGSFKLATKARVPIVPITLNGGYHLYEDQEYIRKGQTIDVLVHPPIETADMSRQELAEVPKKVEAMIREGLEQLK